MVNPDCAACSRATARDFADGSIPVTLAPSAASDSARMPPPEPTSRTRFTRKPPSTLRKYATGRRSAGATPQAGSHCPTTDRGSAGAGDRTYQAPQVLRAAGVDRSSGDLHAHHEAVPDRHGGGNDARVRRRQAVEGAHPLGVRARVRGIHDRAMEERVVAQQQPTVTQQLEAPLEILRQWRLVGVQEDRIERGGERGEHVKRRALQQLHSRRDARFGVGPARHRRVPWVLLDRGEATMRWQRAGEPHAGVSRERAELQDARRAHRPQQHVEQLPLVGGDVDGGQAERLMPHPDGGQDSIFRGEQLGGVAREPLVHAQAVTSTFGKGGTSRNHKPARRDCLSSSTSTWSAMRTTVAMRIRPTRTCSTDSVWFFSTVSAVSTSTAATSGCDLRLAKTTRPSFVGSGTASASRVRTSSGQLTTSTPRSTPPTTSSSTKDPSSPSRSTVPSNPVAFATPLQATDRMSVSGSQR